MFYKKKGKPQTKEVVLCTVKKILPHSVFATLDEYMHLEGMIHISEIAPGRIRNLREYVKEGKRIVCQVLWIKKNGNIDLSLRRVGTSSRVEKLQYAKQEEKAEALLKGVGKLVKKDLREMYKEIGYKAIELYGGLFPFYQEIVSQGEKVLKSVGASKEISEKLQELIKDKIKPREYSIGGVLSLTSYASEGVESIKKILTKIEKKNIKVTYLGAPKYKLEIVCLDPKKASIALKESVNEAIKTLEESGGCGEFSKGG